MIFDELAGAEKYFPLHGRFRQAFEYLTSRPLGELIEGRHDLEGDDLFVLVARSEGKGREKARLECHRRYLDIQVTISGTEEIGWHPLSACQDIDEQYDETRDIAFYRDRPQVWFALPPGKFAIFYPTDVHAPLAASGTAFKAVVKVAL